MILESGEQTINLRERWISLIQANKVQTRCLIGNHVIIYGLKFHTKKGIQQFAIYEETGKPFHLPGEESYASELNDWELQERVTILVRKIKNYRYLYTKLDPSIVSIQKKTIQYLVPKPHDPLICSLCSGEFSLSKREPLVTVAAPTSKRVWDFHWNIAPSDCEGHYLVVPTVSIETNRRGQFIVPGDLDDILDFLFHSSSSDPNGTHSGNFFYNSIGAGASQNHIHFQYFQQNLPALHYQFHSSTDEEFTRKFFRTTNEQSDSLDVRIRTKIHSESCKCQYFEASWTQGSSSREEQLRFICEKLYLLLEIFHSRSRPFNLVLNSNKILLIPRL